MLLATLKPWRKAFKLNIDDTDDESSSERRMTAWESLLWNRWLPKVRSAIKYVPQCGPRSQADVPSNEWDPTSPQPAVHLLESWGPLLPAFLRDNIVDQLILPKVRTAVQDWTGRRGRNGTTPSLASIVFPWLPLLGERIGDVLEEAKRRIRAVLRKWSVTDGVLDELQLWKKDVSGDRPRCGAWLTYPDLHL